MVKIVFGLDIILFSFIVWKMLCDLRLPVKTKNPKETRMLKPQDLLKYLESGNRTEEHLKATEYVAFGGDMAMVREVQERPLPSPQWINVQGLQQQGQAVDGLLSTQFFGKPLATGSSTGVPQSFTSH